MRKKLYHTATNVSINLRNMYPIYSIFLSTASRGHIPDTATKQQPKINQNNNKQTEEKTEKK